MHRRPRPTLQRLSLHNPERLAIRTRAPNPERFMFWKRIILNCTHLYTTKERAKNSDKSSEKQRQNSVQAQPPISRLIGAIWRPQNVRHLLQFRAVWRLAGTRSGTPKIDVFAAQGLNRSLLVFGMFLGSNFAGVCLFWTRLTANPVKARLSRLLLHSY